jgi:hypothetical protein
VRCGAGHLDHLAGHLRAFSEAITGEL